jgi:hypothetical protein
MNALFSQLLQGSQGAQGAGGISQFLSPGRGQGQGAQIPGQESMNMDLSSLVTALGQGQPRSGAIGLPQQQAQLQTAPLRPNQDFSLVLPDREFGTQGMPPSLANELGPNPYMQDPQAMAPMAMGDMQPQQRQVSQQGATGIPSSPQGMAQQGLDWGKLLDLGSGTRDAPNALVRMGEGYNSGGLIGALGYLLTDMSKQATGSSNQGF